METPRLPLSLTPPTPELETLVELLVDDELDAVERRALLERLDEIDGGWKYCATAFLEAQTFRKAFRLLAVAEPAADLFDAPNQYDAADARDALPLADAAKPSTTRAASRRETFDVSVNFGKIGASGNAQIPVSNGELNDFSGFNAAPVDASRRDLPEPRIIPLHSSVSRGSFRRSLGSAGGSGGDGPRRFARFVATATGFFLSVAFGALLYRQIGPTSPVPPASAPPRFEADANFAAVDAPLSPAPRRRVVPSVVPEPFAVADSAGSSKLDASAGPIRFVTLRSPSRSLDDVAVPCVEGDWADLAALRATRADLLDVPQPIVDALRAPGGRVQTVRDEFRFPLEDGRTIVLPVDVYEIRNEFVPIY